MKSHFLAYISRLKWIPRWSLMRNLIKENVAEHSWDVSNFCFTLGLIHNRFIIDESEKVDPYKLATLGIYHDSSEVISGDSPTPIKNHSHLLKSAFKAIEDIAEKELINLLPEYLKDDFSKVMCHDLIELKYKRLLKAADLISALLKCRLELKSGNYEFQIAERDIHKRLMDMNCRAANEFLDTFADSYLLPLDSLLGTTECEFKAAANS
jgi:5'-deoxynucleotidase